MEEKTGNQDLITMFIVALKEKTGNLVSISHNLCKIGKYFLCHHISGKPAVFHQRWWVNLQISVGLFNFTNQTFLGID